MADKIPHKDNISGLMIGNTLQKMSSITESFWAPTKTLSYYDVGVTTPSSESNFNLLPEYQPAHKPSEALSYYSHDVTIPSSAYSLDLPVEAPVVIPRTSRVTANTRPLQIWEGTVLEVNPEEGVMHVMLNDTMNQVPRHSIDINLEWVSDQDNDLVCPGAVFYLTLFKRTKRGTIENSQELRFRRLPSWTKKQLDYIDKESSMLLSKMKSLPIAK